MSGFPNLDLFTLLRPGTAEDRRLVAAFAASCLLHVVAALAPSLGVRSDAMRAPVGGAVDPGPVRGIDVRIEEVGIASLSGSPEGQGTGAEGIPGPQGPAGESPRPAQQLSQGLEVAPVSPPAYYTVDQLTRPPQATSEPDIRVPKVAQYISGSITFKVWVSALGEVDAVEVEKTDLPATVYGVAAEAFRGLRYVPGEIDGRPVGALLRIEVIYRRGVRQP